MLIMQQWGDGEICKKYLTDSRKYLVLTSILLGWLMGPHSCLSL